jgi:hypothetical protein
MEVPSGSTTIASSTLFLQQQQEKLIDFIKQQKESSIVVSDNNYFIKNLENNINFIWDIFCRSFIINCRISKVYKSTRTFSNFLLIVPSILFSNNPKRIQNYCKKFRSIRRRVVKRMVSETTRRL